MLSPRTEIILKAIVGQYISRATPVPSHSITNDSELDVSSATIRNEMVHLEQEGYITRPHPSAGGVPLDKGYRCYVASLGDIEFPIAEQRLVSHLFHQIELELEAWLELAATLTSQKVQNVALISTPRPEACQFKRLELVSLQEMLALAVLVLRGAKVRQQLVAFEQPISQPELMAMANKLNDIYSGVTSSQIVAKSGGLSAAEQRVTDCVVKLMEAEEKSEHEDSYLDGLHFTLNQPEFAHNRWLAQNLMELVEQRTLLKNILPSRPGGRGAQVIIGKENKSDALRDYSVVISRYGLPDEAEGTICVIGPTRMPYARTIATVDYLSRVLSGLVAKLYGGETLPAGLDSVS
ncbi:MAG TPA: heat-inducible transcriptional repressor HrcA [Dehalococcoidales bacterium]|nr:heat-inducible transcriptional repressor HrcA [Dehalococcoidales bacterium]